MLDVIHKDKNQRSFDRLRMTKERGAVETVDAVRTRKYARLSQPQLFHHPHQSEAARRAKFCHRSTSTPGSKRTATSLSRRSATVIFTTGATFSSWSSR